jgi:hypothetical protein
MQYFVGDHVIMKKKHPCGSFQWEVLRVGMDFRLKCCGCGHMVMIPRVKFEKAVKNRLANSEIKQEEER